MISAWGICGISGRTRQTRIPARVVFLGRGALVGLLRQCQLDPAVRRRRGADLTSIRVDHHDAIVTTSGGPSQEVCKCAGD